MASTLDEEDEDVGPLFQRRRLLEEPELDITSMIDMTFLLLIFFIVCSVPDVQKALDLPPARHGIGVDHRQALVITIADAGENQPPNVYLADGKFGDPLPTDREAQEIAVKTAVEQASIDGKTTVLIKAEKGVVHRYVARVATAAASIEGIKLNMAVQEIE